MSVVTNVTATNPMSFVAGNDLRKSRLDHGDFKMTAVDVKS